jgi:hypothetical protein
MWWENVKERDDLENLSMVVRIRVTCVFELWNGNIWILSVRFRQEHMDDFCEHGNTISGSKSWTLNFQAADSVRKICWILFTANFSNHACSLLLCVNVNLSCINFFRKGEILTFKSQRLGRTVYYILLYYITMQRNFPEGKSPCNINLLIMTLCKVNILCRSISLILDDN